MHFKRSVYLVLFAAIFSVLPTHFSFKVDAGVAAEIARATSGARAEAEAALEAAAIAKERIDGAAGEPMRDARVRVF